MFKHFDLVERAHRELLSEGKIKRREKVEEVEQDKGLLTRRAAYYANQRDGSLGLLEKNYGNNSKGYSVDVILNKVTSEYWDVATDDGHNAKPVGIGPRVDQLLNHRWRQPTRELAELSGEEERDPGGVDHHGAAKPTRPSLDEIWREINIKLDAIRLAQDVIKQDSARIEAKINRILDYAFKSQEKLDTIKDRQDNVLEGRGPFGLNIVLRRTDRK